MRSSLAKIGILDLTLGEHTEILGQIGGGYFHTKSAVTRLVYKIQPSCLHQTGSFLGRPMQWRHSNCFRADPWCHGNIGLLWAIFAQNGHIERIPRSSLRYDSLWRNYERRSESIASARQAAGGAFCQRIEISTFCWQKINGISYHLTRFLRSKSTQNASAAGALPRTPLVELKRFLDSHSHVQRGCFAAGGEEREEGTEGEGDGEEWEERGEQREGKGVGRLGKVCLRALLT